MTDEAFIFSIIATVVSVGGILVAVGVFKGRINHNTEQIKAQSAKLGEIATKKEVEDSSRHTLERMDSFIKRSDELLKAIQERAKEDRENGQAGYKQFQKTLLDHEKRIASLETQQASTKESIVELSDTVKKGFRDLADEIKGLRPR